jgi:IMP dehydrogenase / GMP reductase domain
VCTIISACTVFECWQPESQARPAGHICVMASAHSHAHSMPRVLHPSNDRKLRVGAAVGTREEDKQRAQRLHSEGDVDVIILDSSQGME